MPVVIAGLVLAVLSVALAATRALHAPPPGEPRDGPPPD